MSKFFTKDHPITHQQLLAIVDYSPETGVMTRKTSYFANRVGEVMGFDANGYIKSSVLGRPYFNHRLAWFYVHGKWPQGNIDHINGVKTDNRIANLRDVPQQINCENRTKASRRSKSGILGVRQIPGGKWEARIGVAYQLHCIGFFDTPEQASAAYIKAKRAFHEGSTL